MEKLLKRQNKTSKCHARNSFAHKHIYLVYAKCCIRSNLITINIVICSKRNRENCKKETSLFYSLERCPSCDAADVSVCLIECVLALSLHSTRASFYSIASLTSLLATSSNVKHFISFFCSFLSLTIC